MIERTENQEQFCLVLRDFTETTFNIYGSHGFAAGYLRSLAVQMLGELSEKNQKKFIQDMIRSAQKQKAELKEKINQNRTFERV